MLVNTGIPKVTVDVVATADGRPGIEVETSDGGVDVNREVGDPCTAGILKQDHPDCFVSAKQESQIYQQIQPASTNSQANLYPIAFIQHILH